MLHALLQEESRMEEDLKIKKVTVEIASRQVEVAEKVLYDITSTPIVTTEDADLLQDLRRKVESLQSSLDSLCWVDNYT